MDFLQEKIKPIYFKYLGATFGSVLITSIYAIPDTAMVGQYQGPDGTAALAVVAPIWNILYSMGLLMGIGGSVLFSNIKGKSKGNEKQANAYFTTAVIGAVILAVISWIAFIFFDRQLLLLFGAKENLLHLARRYFISMNLGTKLGGRIKQTLRYALGTATFFSIVWTVLSLAAPMLYVRIFMVPTEEILEIAPNIIRSYGISFLLLPLNIFPTYYFQALMKPTAAFLISVTRGLVLSGILIFILPVIAGTNAIWFAMPITELVIAVFVVVLIIRYTKQLPTVGQKSSPLSKDELEHNVRSHLNKLQADPDKISSFFHAPFTAYADLKFMS
ncbi:MAG: MATE family efflux transporter [Ruminococcus sp.]